MLIEVRLQAHNSGITPPMIRRLSYVTYAAATFTPLRAPHLLFDDIFIRHD